MKIKLVLLLKPVYFYNLVYLITYLIIRCKVYLGEYQRKIKEEFSITDIKANHYVLIYGKQIIGTVRIMYENGIADLARVTVIKEYRNQGYGRELIKRVINEVRNSRKAEIIRLYISDKILSSVSRRKERFTFMISQPSAG
ncbi:MAG: GNAT family N-acetyltransferase [Rickettsiaceae bacterium]|nr:GNAT family N-acetyltransferase [Rickettsiaceae bacterium]MCP5378551.1 GNAT family N-acetyltransferase [Rickettsiaceae bacterium]